MSVWPWSSSQKLEPRWKIRGLRLLGPGGGGGPLATHEVRMAGFRGQNLNGGKGSAGRFLLPPNRTGIICSSCTIWEKHSMMIPYTIAVAPVGNGRVPLTSFGMTKAKKNSNKKYFLAHNLFDAFFSWGLFDMIGVLREGEGLCPVPACGVTTMNRRPFSSQRMSATASRCPASVRSSTGAVPGQRGGSTDRTPLDRGHPTFAQNSTNPAHPRNKRVSEGMVVTSG